MHGHWPGADLEVEELNRCVWIEVRGRIYVPMEAGSFEFFLADATVKPMLE